jgi:hypothetical protein
VIVGKDEEIDLTLAAVLCEGHLLIEDVPALDQLSYQRRFHYTLAFPGEHFPVKIEIENRN